MKTSVKSIALFVVVLGISTLELASTASAGQGSKGVSVRASSGGRRVVSHRVNQYGNGLPNPDNDSNGDESGTGTNYPAPTTFGTGTGHGGPVHGGGGNPNPVKPHPLPVQTPPASLPSGSATPK